MLEDDSLKWTEKALEAGLVLSFFEAGLGYEWARYWLWP